MDPRLQEMLDHYEIRKTLAEYCHGCDRCDEPRMAGVYAEGGFDDHGWRRLRHRTLELDVDNRQRGVQPRRPFGPGAVASGQDDRRPSIGHHAG